VSVARDLYNVTTSAVPTPTMSCSMCSMAYPDHHPKCRNFPYGNYHGAPKMPDEIRCDWRSPATHYGGGPHPIPDNLRRCHARKSLHDEEYCRSHRRQTDRKRVRADIQFRNPQFDGLVKALSLMEQLERDFPDDSAIESWERLRRLLQQVTS